MTFVAAFPSDYNGNETNQITTARTLFHYHNSHPPHRKGVRPADQIHQLILQQATAYKDPEYCGMTEACLVDRLKQNLATITESITATDTEKIYDNRKYYNQAHNLLKIATRRPVPHFLISVSDLWPELLKELRILDRSDRKFVLKQAVGRIFEDINSVLYYNSISRVLEVSLQQGTRMTSSRMISQPMVLIGQDREIMPSLTLPWRTVIISRLAQESELKAQFLFLSVKIVYQNSGQTVAPT